MLYDYKCSKCDFTDEYSTSPSVPKDMNPPKKCPKCKKGKMVKEFSIECKGKAGIDVIGGFEYVYGKKNFNKGTAQQKADRLLSGNPY